jgi:DNA repair photolyase
VPSGVTDAYQPIERRLKLTRACLRVLADFRNPVFVVTKNHLVTRDGDYLAELAEVNASGVAISITTLERDLGGLLEPRASIPTFRLEAIAVLRNAGIPVGVNVAPIIPGLNEHEVPSILKAAAGAGAQFAAYTIVRLPLAVAPIFVAWLETHFPERKEKILGRIRSIRDGKLNSSKFGSRMRGEGPIAEQIRQLFQISCRRFGLDRGHFEVNAKAFHRISPNQPELPL